MIKVKGDALFALVLLAIFSFGTYRATVMEDPFGGPNDVGAAFFPFWVCVFIQSLCTLVFVQSVMKSSKETVPGSEDGTASIRKRIILLGGILALLFLYIFVMETVGFIISSAGFMVLVHQLLVLSKTGRPTSLMALGVSAVFFTVLSGSLFFMFNTLFKLALP